VLSQELPLISLAPLDSFSPAGRSQYINTETA